MICIYCLGETRVVNSRHQKRPNTVWRRRHCQQCGTVFTSIEEADLSASIVVRKPEAKTNDLEPFSRDKLMLSIYDSLKHRKTALKDAQSLTRTIINQIHNHTHEACVDTYVIVEVSLKVLQRFDKIAATHYAAFHPEKRV
ncbi:MAG: hypothetical protein U5K77_01160 [Candidatus Saccharibacteria bacterium]|nr:hypothetical protein [Candidatus Saccharibacteria bacterium]